jgi:hypothetical protein
MRGMQARSLPCAWCPAGSPHALRCVSAPMRVPPMRPHASPSLTAALPPSPWMRAAPYDASSPKGKLVDATAHCKQACSTGRAGASTAAHCSALLCKLARHRCSRCHRPGKDVEAGAQTCSTGLARAGASAGGDCQGVLRVGKNFHIQAAIVAFGAIPLLVQLLGLPRSPAHTAANIGAARALSSLAKTAATPQLVPSLHWCS